jgi:hypothetical protein
MSFELTSEGLAYDDDIESGFGAAARSPSAEETSYVEAQDGIESPEHEAGDEEDDEDVEEEEEEEEINPPYRNDPKFMKT